MDDPKPVTPEKQPETAAAEPDTKAPGAVAPQTETPFDDKQPETYVNSAGEPVKIAPLDEVSAAPKKSGAGKWLVRGLVILSLAALGALAYWQYTEAEAAKTERASLQNELDTVKEANSSAADEQDKPVASPPVTELTNKDQLTAAAQLYIAASNTDSSSVVREVIIEDRFAVVVVGDKTSAIDNEALIYEKVKDSWTLLSVTLRDALDEEDKSRLSKGFGVPDSIIEKA